MRAAIASLGVFLGAAPLLAGAATFQVVATDASPWLRILGAVNITPAATTQADILVAGPDARIDPDVAENRILILVGSSTTAAKFGIHSTAETVLVRHIADIHAPKMEIFWQQPLSIPFVEVPADFRIFAAEKSKSAAVLAGKRTSHGAVLWLATDPGKIGFERYPYLLQALADLGLTFPARSTSLWAFFDSSYRIRADLDYLARRWRESGIAALHVAAWHNMEPDPVQDDFLKRLVEACHKNGILVYAWLELPHVSERFWADHPQWREKTAAGQDAQLDWRKLMDLQNPDCRRAVIQEIHTLLGRFDWDGVNVAELYFESLEGASNPARFTPMNDDVRAEFQHIGGFDPKLLFDPASPYFAAKNPAALHKFLDYRAELASRIQAEWLDVIDRERAAKPYLDVVLTHIDDRFEPDIRNALGADIARSLPLIQARRATLLVEDPATLWNLGPDRYAKLAQKYRELAPAARDIAVDINIVERYQDVYPTKKQTGVELLELVHQAAVSFRQVALYFENSIERQDLALLPVAATTAKVVQEAPDEVLVEALRPTRVAWQGPAEIDGRLWPVGDGNWLLVPSGRHQITPAVKPADIGLRDFNGEIRSAVSSLGRTEIAYASRTRAIAVLAKPVPWIEVDGVRLKDDPCGDSVLLPAGEHVLTLRRDVPARQLPGARTP